MAKYTDNISFVNPNKFVNDENINAPIKEIKGNVDYIIDFLNGNKALLSGVYGNLWDYDRDGRRVTYNGGKFDTYKKANSFLALNHLQIANDDEITWDNTASRVVYKGQSDVVIDRPKWIEREVYIPEVLRDQNLIFALKASGCTAATGWTTENAVCETIAIQVLGGESDVQKFVNVGKWESHLYYSNDSYGAEMTTVVVPFKASKSTKSIKIKIFRTSNTNYLHIDKVFIGGLCLPYNNDTETYNLNNIDINEFFDYENVCTKVNSTSVLGHKVADSRNNIRGNDLMTWQQFNQALKEIITYGSVHTTSLTPATSGTSGSPDIQNWNEIEVLPIYGNLQGKVYCNTLEKVYRVDHPRLENPSCPLITVEVPTSGSSVFAHGVFDVQNDHFSVILSDIPNVSGYVINWSLGNSFSPREAIDALNIPDTNAVECPVPTTYPDIFNYESNA